MLLFYIRHGEPIYEPDGLTSDGFVQADALVSRLGSLGLDKIFSSTSNRALQTARPTAEAIGKDITELDWCNEAHAWHELTVRKPDGRLTWCWAYPPMREFLLSPEIRRLDSSWYEHPYFDNTKFKEGFLRIEHETHAFLASLGYSFDKARGMYKAVAPTDERIALFAHQGFGLAFLSALLNIPYPMVATHLDMTYTGVSVIEFKGELGDSVSPVLLQLSNDSHLFKSGIETNYNNRVKL